MYLVAGGVATLDSVNRMQSKFQSNQRTDPAIHERIAFLKDQRSLILAEMEQLKCEQLQTTTIARRIDRVQQDYNLLVEEETVLTPGPLSDPLDVLPPELWPSIMPDSPDDTLILTMVSSRWRQVLLSLPALWSTIILDNTQEDYWAKAITCLELSRPLEITLRIDLPLELWTGISPTILAERERIRSVTFCDGRGWVPAKNLDALTKFETLPALRCFHLPRESQVSSQTVDCLIFRISPRLEQVTGFHFHAGALADPNFNTLRGVIDIGPVDKEMAAALTGMDNLSSLYIRESWSMGDGAHSRNSGPLYLPSVSRFQYDGHSPIHALQFIGDNLVEFTPYFNIHDMLKLLMEVGRFPVLQQLDAFIYMELTDKLDACDPTLARHCPSLRHLQLHFQDVAGWDHMAKQEAIDYVAGREEMFTSIFSLLVTTIPYAQKVWLRGRFMVDPALKYTRSLRELQSLTIRPESKLYRDDEIQRIACLPYILPPKFLDGHCPLSRLDWYNPALRSHHQVILADPSEELGSLQIPDTISAVPIPSVTALSLRTMSPVLFYFDVFPNLQSIELSGSLSVIWASDFFEELILRPNQWPLLEKISLSGLYMEWDILILMLERRNFVTESNIKRIKTLEFTTRLPYKLLYPITQLLKGKFVDRPPLIELSIEAIGNHLRDSTLTGCHQCIRTFRECNSKPYTYGVDTPEFLGGLLLSGDRWLGWRYELPFERVHPDPPLSPEAVQCLEGKWRRRLEFMLSCREAEKEFGRTFWCPESRTHSMRPIKMAVGGYCMDGVFMSPTLDPFHS